MFVVQEDEMVGVFIAAAFTITSAAFTDGGNIPSKFTCDAGQHRLHRLAGTVPEQALQVATQRRRVQPGTEGALELLQIAQQPTHAWPCALIEHRPTAYRNSVTRTMSSLQITRDLTK